MEKEIVEEIARERIKENEELFSKEELETIKNNYQVVKKIYLLGLINGRNIYGDNA